MQAIDTKPSGRTEWKTKMAASAAALLLAAAVPARAGDGCGSALVVEPSPNPAEAEVTRPLDVAVIAPDDIWLVGLWRNIVGFSSTNLPLTAHFDGAAWTLLPAPLALPSHLNAVDGLATGEVYAAGVEGDISDGSSIFILSWDGTAWQRLEDDDFFFPEDPAVVLHGIHAVDSSHVWFVGGGEIGPGFAKGIVFRYDGSDFERFVTPIDPLTTTGAHVLRGVSALAPDDVWAAGGAGGGAAGIGRSYVVRFDGTSWQQVPTPHFGFGTVLRDVVAIAPDDVWVCGQFDQPSGGGPVQAVPLFLHWDGADWTRFDAPAFAEDLVALGPNDVYGVEGEQLIHWDGSAWSLVAELPDGPPNFNGVGAIGPCELVIVGSEQFTTQDETSLVVRYEPTVVCQTDLGFQGPGEGLLTLCGDALSPGGVAVLELSGAKADAPAWLAVSAAKNPIPLLGGTLVPSFPLHVFPTMTDARGSWSLVVNGGAPQPIMLYAQMGWLDPMLPQQVGFSNAIAVELLD